VSGPATDLPRLRGGERVLLSDRESRPIRALADGFVCVVSMFAGVAFNTFVMAGDGSGGLGAVAIIGLTLLPIFLLMTARPLGRVVLTDQRIILGTDTEEVGSAEYHQIRASRIWLATLFLRLRDGKTLSIANMPRLYAIESLITQRRVS